MKPQAQALRVRRILPGESLGNVQRLRREVYFHEQGQQREDSRRIVDGLDGSGTVIVVESGADAVGTLRIHDFEPLTVQVEYGRLFQIDEFARAWPLSQVAVGTRLAVQSDQRIKGVVDRLIEETYRYALEHQIRFGLVACEPSLHGLFEYYGFREYLPPAILPNGDAVLRMLLVLEDAQHLRECDSPLQQLVREPAAADGPLAWMRRTFKLAH
ncbi:MAG: hypothetical protein ABIP44_02555 [Pseudoxanthomonas sp.]